MAIIEMTLKSIKKCLSKLHNADKPIKQKYFLNLLIRKDLNINRIKYNYS